MPIIIKCHSCGFILGVLSDLYSKDPDTILKRFGYRCPCCLSPLSPAPVKWIIEVAGRRKMTCQEFIDRYLVRIYNEILIRRKCISIDTLITEISLRYNVDVEDITCCIEKLVDTMREHGYDIELTCGYVCRNS